MAHIAKDGTPFTNRPMMTSHDARTAQRKPGEKVPSESAHERQEAGETFACPHCGGQISMSAVHDDAAPPTDNQDAGTHGFGV
jgi:hypothetical protein